MEYSGEGVSVYAEAKGEYTRQLCQYLTPALQKYFLDLFQIAKERETDAKKHLLSFQTLLEGISEWNVDKVQRETQAVAISTQCDYLEELLTAVFIAHTKVLSAIRLTNKQKKLQITIPKLEHFLHRTLTECARLLWKDVYLFAGTGTSIERQKNMRQVEGLISEGILLGVRTMLPVKSILREYLSTDDSDEEEVEGEGEEEEEEEEEEKEKPIEAAELGEEKDEKPEKPAEEEEEKPVQSATGSMKEETVNTIEDLTPADNLADGSATPILNLEEEDLPPAAPPKRPEVEAAPPAPISRPSTPRLTPARPPTPIPIEEPTLMPFETTEEPAKLKAESSDMELLDMDDFEFEEEAPAAKSEEPPKDDLSVIEFEEL